jgi:hypothetical protein
MLLKALPRHGLPGQIDGMVCEDPIFVVDNMPLSESPKRFVSYTRRKKVLRLFVVPDIFARLPSL